MSTSSDVVVIDPLNTAEDAMASAIGSAIEQAVAKTISVIGDALNAAGDYAVQKALLDEASSYSTSQAARQLAEKYAARAAAELDPARAEVFSRIASSASQLAAQAESQLVSSVNTRLGVQLTDAASAALKGLGPLAAQGLGQLPGVPLAASRIDEAIAEQEAAGGSPVDVADAIWNEVASSVTGTAAAFSTSM